MRKKQYIVCSVAELKTLETHFSNMAERGWLIDKINLFSYEYKKIKPQKLQFFVDILPQITAFDYPENDDAIEYRHLCEQSGWTFAAASKQVHIFYSEDETTLPIHTDCKIEAKIMLNACRKYELPFFIIGLVYLIYMCINLAGKGYDTFLYNTTIAQAVSLVFFAIPLFWYLAFDACWYIRTVLCIKNSASLPHVDYRFAKARGKILCFSLICIIILNIAAIVLDIIGGVPAMPFAIVLVPFAGLGVGLFIRRRVDTKKRTRKANVKIFVLGIAGIIALSIGITIFIISSLGSSLSNEKPLPNDKAALKLSDFGVASPPNVYNYYGSGSIIVPHNYTYYEINENGRVHTVVKKSISKYISERLFNSTLAEWQQRQWISENSIIKISDAEVLLFGAISGYYLYEDKSQILLLYKNAVLNIDYNGDTLDLSTVVEKIKTIGSSDIY